LLARALTVSEARRVLYRKQKNYSVIFSVTNFPAANNRANTHFGRTEQSAHQCVSGKELRLISSFQHAETAPTHSLLPGTAGSTPRDEPTAQGQRCLAQLDAGWVRDRWMQDGRTGPRLPAYPWALPAPQKYAQAPPVASTLPVPIT